MNRKTMRVPAWFVAAVLLSLEIGGVLAQNPPPVIKSEDKRIWLVEGHMEFGAMRALILDPGARPWTVEVPFYYPKPMKVWLANDQGDGVELMLEPDGSFDFEVRYGNTVVPARLIGRKVVPPLISIPQGNPSDAKASRGNGPVLQLDGGGWPGDVVLQGTIDRLRGCTSCGFKLDVVFISAVEPKSRNIDMHYFLTDHFFLLNGVDSVETFVLKSPERSNSDQLVKALDGAELVYFDGGRPCELIQTIRGFKAEASIKALFKRGGGIAGTGAGQTLQGPITINTCEEKSLSDIRIEVTNGAFQTIQKKFPQATQAEEAVVNVDLPLADPYDGSVTFESPVFDWPDLKNTIVESRAASKKQLGRVFAVLARQLKDGKIKTAHAIAVDENASVVIDGNGMATVAGKSVAYFITADHKPEICEKGKPLTYSDFKVWKLKPGETYNLRKRPAVNFYNVSVTDGKLSRDPY